MIVLNDSYISSGSRMAKFILLVAKKFVPVEVINNFFVYERLKELADDTAEAGGLMFGMIARPHS